jgi:hypothetical protein
MGINKEMADQPTRPSHRLAFRGPSYYPAATELQRAEMPEQFDIAARRHLDTAESLEIEGRLDDAGYHYGLAGENAVKQSIVTACGSLPKALRKHFDVGLRDAIQASQEVLGLLANGRLGGGLAADLQTGNIMFRFDKWDIRIRYADTDYPVDPGRVASWKADAIALLNGGVF